MSSSLGLLSELVDDAHSLQILRENTLLKDAVDKLLASFRELRGEDHESVLEELEMLSEISKAWEPPDPTMLAAMNST